MGSVRLYRFTRDNHCYFFVYESLVSCCSFVSALVNWYTRTEPLNARASLFQRDSDQRFVTKICLDYENKTSVNKKKKNENT